MSIRFSPFTGVVIGLCLLFSLPSQADEPDLEYGEEIFDTCAPCHGPYGQGGGGGLYPRLAGMSADYIIRQLDRFKTRVRENIPMIPYTDERDLPDDDVEVVAEYLETIKLITEMPPANGEVDGLIRLKQAKQVLAIPRHPGNDKQGAKLYAEFCVKCHGVKGEGTNKGPLLGGQHIPYLSKQIEAYIDGKRRHLKAKLYFNQRTAEEINSILAYLSLLDD